MSEANRALVHEWFREVWNKKDEAAIDRLFHPEAKSHGFPDPDGFLVGPEGFKTIFRSFCGAFPDINVEVLDVLVEGDRAAIRWKTTMTHTGHHLGIPPSGKKVELTGSSFIRANGHQILEGWNFMDLQAMINKLQAS